MPIRRIEFEEQAQDVTVVAPDGLINVARRLTWQWFRNRPTEAFTWLEVFQGIAAEALPAWIDAAPIYEALLYWAAQGVVQVRVVRGEQYYSGLPL